MTQHHEAAENNGNADHEGTKEGLSRRQFLGLAGLGALTLGLGGGGGFALGRHAGDGIDSDVMKKTYEFRGEHQQGIITPAQQQMHTAAFDLTTTNRDTLIELLQDWTLAAERLTHGELVKDYTTSLTKAPADTGESMGLGPAGLTITFGVGKTLFIDDEGRDRFGLGDKLPVALRDGIPPMAAEKLDPKRGGGDLIIQATTSRVSLLVARPCAGRNWDTGELHRPRSLRKRLVIFLASRMEHPTSRPKTLKPNWISTCGSKPVTIRAHGLPADPTCACAKSR